MTTEERFWAKVNKKGPFPPKYTKVKTRCWLWTGSKTSRGYGLFGNGKGKVVLAHRYSYELNKGKLALFHGLHRCDNTSCVRPSHVFKGTHRDNMSDMTSKGRRISLKGSMNAAAILTENKVLRIRELYATHKWSQQRIADKFNVSQHTISRIVRRLLWMHV